MSVRRVSERDGLRVLVVYAHPLPTSFLAAVRSHLVATLRSRGHEVDDLDLYAEKFDPVLSPNQMRSYVDTNLNFREVESYVERLRAADALILVFPVWFDGLPAIMQGYFQRVFLPGVATVIDTEGLFHRNLQNLKRIAAVCAYGESRSDVAKKLDPPRRFVRDNIGVLMDPNGSFDYVALYDMNFSTASRREAFLKRVKRVFASW
jgi:putative NADPH-quinone reductase